jgi:glutaredoxin 3
MLTVYSKNNCPFCDRTKALLESKGVAFTEVNIENDPESRQMLVDAGLRSVPQIYHGFELIPGGFDGLSKKSAEFFEKVKSQ